ncbi:hypothetical protein CONPUDRAFT_78197 [Coniophora puteana RWD-64-598 SS2]|uniref:F-box domain-containing protein n=1 Tax=Coniophora puteana (strain RWD-64-598) TaxID=741705 RepID=R7SGR4_CONPW|nr:uncharacterized protein CONPUDRAFT_78197 [Coniophora puteana RWD-64-598 SS2]EIW74229.1 hypothetical protein CONPUDRAFT_78197 [Coniophora puteana RWD-64-598 SS2]
MHPCLEILELLEQIVSHVEDKDSLAKFARVCRSFQEPALDALYINVECFFEFFVSLSSDVCYLTDFVTQESRLSLAHAELEGFTRRRLVGAVHILTFATFISEHVQMFKRDISPSEWSALITRAARVKTIRQTIYQRSSSKILSSIDVVDALNKCPVPNLFPNLRALYYILPFGSLNPRLLLGPQLRHLIIAETAVALCATLPMLPMWCPLLETLNTASVSSWTPSELVHASNVVVQWRHLRSLSIGPVNEPILTHIASLQPFHRLALDALTDSSPWLRTTQTIHIRNVDRLIISGDTLQTCAEALGKLFSPPPGINAGTTRVSELNLRGKSPSFSAIAAAINTYIYPENLTRLSIAMIGSEPDSSTGFDIRDFPRFSQLRRFSYLYRPSDQGNHVVTAEQTLAAISHWPLLEELHIYPTIKPPLSFVDLMTVFWRCPHLRDLGLTVSVCLEDVVTVLGSPELKARNDHISTMRFETAPGTTLDVKTVVALLRETIPQLSTINALDSDAHFWDAVSNGLRRQPQDDVLH